MELINKFLQKYTPSDNLSKATEEIINQFKEKLPATLLDIWAKYGFGNYGNGLIKIVNPNDYMPSLYSWLGGENPNRIPIMITGFGNILYYRILTQKDYDVCVLDIHNRSTDVCAYSFDDFIDIITDDKIIENVLDKDLFEQSIKKYGNIEENEIFSFVPALAFGGQKSVENIQKGIATVYQHLLFEMLCNQSDNDESNNEESDMWSEAYEANPHVLERNDGTLMVNFTLTDTVDTILPTNPEDIYTIDDNEISLWVLTFFSYDNKTNIGTFEYHAALKALEKYIVEKRDNYILLRGISLEEMKEIISELS